MAEQKEYFQNYMPGNVCYGCSVDNPNGLQIKSYWEGDEAICLWQAKSYHHGWPGLMNGGIIASLVDCHCMCTAMAHAYKIEGRSLDSEPHYKYATGTMTIKYVQPTSNDLPVLLKARVIEVKGKKTTLACEVYSGDQVTVTAEVIALSLIHI